MSSTGDLIVEALRWARRNDWRPERPDLRRRLSLYWWTNQVPDPGNRHQSTLRVRVNAASGVVQVNQLMTHRWVQIAEVRVGCLRTVLDVLAALSVIPAEFSPTHRLAQHARQVRRPEALAALDMAVDHTGREQGDPMPTPAELLDALTDAGYTLVRI